jgi:hypothetical protein
VVESFGAMDLVKESSIEVRTRDRDTRVGERFIGRAAGIVALMLGWTTCSLLIFKALYFQNVVPLHSNTTNMVVDLLHMEELNQLNDHQIQVPGSIYNLNNVQNSTLGAWHSTLRFVLDY